jgi:CheY-like chemotaxis protein
MNILVVDDQADIREVLTFVIHHELKANIVTAISGNKAVDILKTQKFDVVICDFNMPDGNGLVVHDYIKLSAPETKFVFCSSEMDTILNQADNVFFHIKKPNIFDYVKELKEKLSESLNFKFQKEDEFTELSLSLIAQLSPLPFDLYLKLAENNFVKYFTIDHEVTNPEIENLIAKGAFYLQVKSSDIEKAKHKLITIISKEVMKLDQQNSIEGSAAVQEFVAKYFLEFGYDPQVQEMAMKNLQQTMNLILKEKDLDNFLVGLLKMSSYSRKLYAVTVCFSANLLKSIKLLNDHTLSKMIAAIYLQDIFISRNELLSFFTKFEVEGFQWKTSKEEEQFYMHPVKASEFIKKTDFQED